MAAPVIADSATGAQTTAATTWTLNYPSGISAGDLILVIIGGQASGFSSTTLAGAVQGTLGVSGHVVKARAAGGESGTFDITWSGATSGGWAVYRITGWDGDLGFNFSSSNAQLSGGIVGTVTTSGPGTTPDPPSLDPAAWDTEDTLYFAVAHCSADAGAWSGFPSGYSNTYGTSNTSPAFGFAVASKQTTGASSDNPGTFTCANSVTCRVATIAVRSLFGPTIQNGDTKTGSVTSNSTSWTITYPSNLASGDLILVIGGSDGTQIAGSGPSATGFTESAQADGSSASCVWVLAKISDGTETGTFTLTMPASEQGPWTSLRITNWYGSGIPAWTGTGFNGVAGDGLQAGTTNSIGTSTSADPPSLDPTNWASEDTLWFAISAWDSTPTATAKDANYSYTEAQPMSSGGSNGAGLAVSHRRVNAASADPGAYTLSAAETSVSMTLAVRPAAVAVSSLVLTQGFTDFMDPGIC